ncbi:unnamed protein product [Ixodes persulcatus]
MKIEMMRLLCCLTQIALASTGFLVASHVVLPQDRAVTLPPSNSKVTQAVGEQLRFLCYKPISDDAATFTWHFNSFEIPPDPGLQDGLYTYKITNGHLQPSNISYSVLAMGHFKRAHAGNYSCHVFSGGSLEQTLQIQLDAVNNDNVLIPSTKLQWRSMRYGRIVTFSVVSKLRDAPCDDDEQCASVDLVSLCHEGRCICAPGYYLNDTTCMKSVGLGSRCGMQSVCHVPSLECKDGQCVCVENAGNDDPNDECNVVSTSGLFTKIVLYAALAVICSAVLFLAGAVIFCEKKYNLKEQFQGAFYVNCNIL